MIDQDLMYPDLVMVPEHAGRVSVEHDGTEATFTGCASFTGRVLAGGQLVALPADSSPVFVGNIARVEGEYESATLPLMAAYEGTEITNARFYIVFGMATATMAELNALLARYRSQLMQGAGLFYHIDDITDPTLIPPNSVRWNEDAERLEQWRNGVWVVLSQSPLGISRGEWSGISPKHSLSIVTGDVAVSGNDGPDFSLTLSNDAELQLFTDVEVGDTFDFLVIGGGTGNTFAFAAGFTGMDAASVNLESGARTRFRAVVTAETGGTATEISVDQVSYDASNLVVDNELVFRSNIDDNTAEPNSDALTVAERSDENWTWINLPSGPPGIDGEDGTGLRIDHGPVADLTERDAYVGIAVDETIGVSNVGDGRSAIYRLLDDSPQTWSAPLYTTPAASSGAGLLKCRTVATTNVNISSALESGDTLNGVTLATDDVVLLTGQSTTHENGPYVVPASGAASRHPDFNTFDDIAGSYFAVMEGTAHADTLWRCTSNKGGTLGSTALAFDEVDSISNSELAVMAQATVKGRAGGAGTGTPTDLTLTQVLDMVGSAAQGDILYRGSSAWQRLAKGTAYQILRQNSGLTAPEWSTARIVQTGGPTLYVSTSGSDSTGDGTFGNPFATATKAYNVGLTYDLAGNNFTIQFLDGTHTNGLSVNAPLLGGNLILAGNSGATTNVVWSAATPFSLRAAGMSVTLQNMRVSGSAVGLTCDHPGALMTVGAGMSFAGSPSAYHIYAANGGKIGGGNSMTFASGAGFALGAVSGIIEFANLTMTMSGTPAWSGSFARFVNNATIVLFNVTMSGSATGSRYTGSTNSVLDSGGAGTASTYFPGNSNGTTGTGAQQI